MISEHKLVPVYHSSQSPSVLTISEEEEDKESKYEKVKFHRRS